MGWFESAKSWVGERARDVEVAAQGVTRGLASGVAGVGDLAVGVGYNWTVRHLTGGEKVETNFADRAANAVTWTEARNNRERAIMAGGQVVGEVAGFVAVTVATGGVGGAAVGGSLAAMRGANLVRGAAGAANAARTATVATEAAATATRAASATARFMNPLASKLALGVEGGFGTLRGVSLYREDQAASTLADNVRTEMAEGVIDTAVQEQTALSNSAARVRQNLESVMTELEDPNLTTARHTELMTQLDQLEAHNAIIERLQNPDLSAEQRAALWEDLKAADPAVQAELNGESVAAATPADSAPAQAQADAAAPAATTESPGAGGETTTPGQTTENPDDPQSGFGQMLNNFLMTILGKLFGSLFGIGNNESAPQTATSAAPAATTSAPATDTASPAPTVAPQGTTPTATQQQDLYPAVPRGQLGQQFSPAAAAFSAAPAPAINQETEKNPVYKAPALTAPVV
ncbi:MAG: hypothetical protein ACXW4B_11390 [Micavibrio sp.]